MLFVLCEWLRSCTRHTEIAAEIAISVNTSTTRARDRSMLATLLDDDFGFTVGISYSILGWYEVELRVILRCKA